MKRLLGDIRRADEDFHMIARGDRVAVGVSGGKDSLVLLRALAVYSRFAVKPFEVVAITLKTGDPFDVAPIRALCEELGGYIASSSERTTGTNALRTLNMELRIPSAQLDAFLEGMSGTGRVTSRSEAM